MRKQRRRTIYWLCAALLGGLAVQLRAQEAAKTEVVVIGTVHSPTARYTQETLEGLLKKIAPDLLLLEFDKSFFDNSFAILDKFKNVSMETKAVLAYQKTAKVGLRPYDIEGRNPFYQKHDYFNRETNLNQELGRLYSTNQLNAEAKAMLDSLFAVAQIRDACGQEGPSVINSGACDKAVEKKQYYAYKGIGKIIDLTPALKEHKAFWDLADAFWVRRNDEMVNNISRYAKEVAGKKVVVLCGYEHRYYLRTKLLERARAENFMLREYWEYEGTR